MKKGSSGYNICTPRGPAQFVAILLASSNSDTGRNQQHGNRIKDETYDGCFLQDALCYGAGCGNIAVVKALSEEDVGLVTHILRNVKRVSSPSRYKFLGVAELESKTLFGRMHCRPPNDKCYTSHAPGRYMRWE